MAEMGTQEFNERVERNEEGEGNGEAAAVDGEVCSTVTQCLPCVEQACAVHPPTSSPPFSLPVVSFASSPPPSFVCESTSSEPTRSWSLGPFQGNRGRGVAIDASDAPPVLNLLGSQGDTLVGTFGMATFSSPQGNPVFSMDWATAHQVGTGAGNALEKFLREKTLLSRSPARAHPATNTP